MNIPNGKICFSIPQNRYVALHQFEDKQIWVVYLHADGRTWVTMRKATEDDIRAFKNARNIDIAE